jgi:hypothetical protein
LLNVFEQDFWLGIISEYAVHNAPRGEPHLRDVVDAAGEAATMKGMALRIPAGLAASCYKTLQRAAWLDRLPDVVRNLEHRWSLTLDAPFDDEGVSRASTPE